MQRLVWISGSFARVDGGVVGDNGRQDALEQHFLRQIQRFCISTLFARVDGSVVKGNGRQDALEQHFLQQMQRLMCISGPFHTR